MIGPWDGEVSIEIDGQTFTGRYRVDGKGILTVTYGPYSKSTQHRGPDSPKPMGGYCCESAGSAEGRCCVTKPPLHYVNEYRDVRGKVRAIPAART